MKRYIKSSGGMMNAVKGQQNYNDIYPNSKMNSEIPSYWDEKQNIQHNNTTTDNTTKDNTDNTDNNDNSTDNTNINNINYETKYIEYNKKLKQIETLTSEIDYLKNRVIYLTKILNTIKDE